MLSINFQEKNSSHALPFFSDSGASIPSFSSHPSQLSLISCHKSKPDVCFIMHFFRRIT
jgi:hypothetical protein